MSETSHQESLKRYYANHPDHLARAHRAFLGGISDEAQAYMEANNLPHLAHHPEMENIRNSPKNEHLQRVKRLREQELSGPENDKGRDNREVDFALGDRAKRTAGHTRSRVERY